MDRVRNNEPGGFTTKTRRHETKRALCSWWLCGEGLRTRSAAQGPSSAPTSPHHAENLFEIKETFESREVLNYHD